jgi:hypothetical protein
MKLIEIFLPLTDNSGRKLRKELFVETRRELIERFGGLTAYSRSPRAASGRRRAGRRATRLSSLR